MQIASATVVAFEYTLTDGDGAVIDQSPPGEPLSYLHGAGNIVPGLERQLEGLAVGDERTCVVPPNEGYGLATNQGIRVPRAEFPDEMEPQVGMAVGATGPDGKTVPLFIKGVSDEEVFLSFDHPLAGVTLHFAVAIRSIRAASDEELAHGHPHGPGGHHHHGHEHE